MQVPRPRDDFVLLYVDSLNSILSNLSETDTALFNSCYQLLQRSLKVKKCGKRKSTDTGSEERSPQAKRSMSRPKVNRVGLCVACTRRSF